jgi:hypothetical protein
MVGIVRVIYAAGCYWWMASVAATSICILCCIPLDAVCLVTDELPNSPRPASEILNQINAHNPDVLIEEFDRLNDVFDESGESLAEGRKFLQSFIEEVNSRYGLTLTMSEACKLVRENLHTLQVPLETQNIILTTIRSLEAGSDLMPGQKPNFQQIIEADSLAITGPAYWFISKINKETNRKEHKDVQLKLDSFVACQANSTLMDTELPGNCYLGGCELLAGALIFILPIPGAAWLGGIMIGDGFRRVADGVIQLSDERRADPNYVPPTAPFGVDF